jgi:DNA modification methylase
MQEIGCETIDLVVTSPPYWHIKDYGVPNQIGYGQSLHAYLKDLYRVLAEVWRVLGPGRRLCINIGDQFARSATFGRYKVIPLHAEVITQCEQIGFDFMGSIIWQKKTSIDTTGGATVMGSFPYPPNGIVEIDYEYIHILKKPGDSPTVAKAVKEASKMEKIEWKSFFSGHWHLGGARKIEHEAMFPHELPRRLIKMFSFVGETVLDPFAGSGTTLRAALDLGRNAVGYEVNRRFVPAIMTKLDSGRPTGWKIEVTERRGKIRVRRLSYVPGIRDAELRKRRPSPRTKPESLHKVTGIVGPKTLELEGGLKVSLLGIRISDRAATLDYLRRYVLGKQVFLRFDGKDGEVGGILSAYVYLKNRIFVNAYLIKSGLASPDQRKAHRMRAKFTGLGSHP